MKKKILALGCMAALLAFGSEAQAAPSSVTATASATIVTALSITNTGGTNLAFGTIAPGASAGLVTVSAAGVRTADGNVQLITSTASAAPFSITGSGSLACSVTIPASVSITNGTVLNDMLVDLSSDLSNAALVSLVGGVKTFNVGGTLHVGANQAAGSYSKTFDVSVVYN